MSVGDQSNCCTPSMCTEVRFSVFVSLSSFIEDDSYTAMQSSPSRAKYWSSCDHLKAGHIISSPSLVPCG